MNRRKHIFSYNADISKNTYLNWRVDRGSPQGNLTQLADGYALAAIKLIEDVLKDNKAKNADILIFPIMYSMDQMIELYLKAIICEVEVLSEGKANSYKTHDIKSLFDTMTAKIKKKEIKTTGLEKHLASTLPQPDRYPVCFSQRAACRWCQQVRRPARCAGRFRLAGI